MIESKKMTKQELQLEIDKLNEWFAEQNRIYGEKMALLVTEREKFPEDRIDLETLENQFVAIDTKIMEEK